MISITSMFFCSRSLFTENQFKLPGDQDWGFWCVSYLWRRRTLKKNQERANSLSINGFSLQVKLYVIKSLPAKYFIFLPELCCMEMSLKHIIFMMHNDWVVLMKWRNCGRWLQSLRLSGQHCIMGHTGPVKMPLFELLWFLKGLWNWYIFLNPFFFLIHI